VAKVSGKRGGALGVVLAALYLAGVLAVTVLVRVWGDAWWLATIPLFGPRWIWAAPLPLLAIVCARARRRAVSLALLGAAVLPLLLLNDVRVSPRGLGALGVPPAGAVRVMTYNVGGGTIEAEAVAEMLVSNRVDAAALPECGDLDKRPLVRRGYAVRMDSGMCLVTLLPIVRSDVRDPADLLKLGGNGAIDRYDLAKDGRPFSLTIVHLETVREGLSEALEMRFWKRSWKGPEMLAANLVERAAESNAALAWVRRSKGPSIVMGDFNMPVESAIYRRYWSSFHNALSSSAFGLPATKFTRWFGVRIDHVLHDDAFTCTKAWVGPSLGGDHKPVFADLVFTAR
jgi:endonuclease/exonuclease/phosphatase (EEP) superfamily protein YafD